MSLSKYLSGNAGGSPHEIGRTLTDKDPCAPLRIEAVSDAGEIMASVIVQGPLGVPGTKYSLRQDSGHPGPTLQDIAFGKQIDGDRSKCPPSAVGDILIYEQSRKIPSGLLVGQLAGRSHDGLHAGVQVARVLARLTAASVSKAGVTQFVQIIDPSRAKVARSRSDVVKFAEEELDQPWPGGRYGLVMRDGRGAVHVLAEVDGKRMQTPAELAAQIVKGSPETFGAPFEMFPIWMMPTGREQYRREVGYDADGRVIGRVTSMYGTNRRDFLPSIAILTDGAEWAFGAPTGQDVRVAHTIHPLTDQLRFSLNTVPTAVTEAKKKPGQVRPVAATRLLYHTEEQIEEMTADRALRREGAPAFNMMH